MEKCETLAVPEKIYGKYFLFPLMIISKYSFLISTKRDGWYRPFSSCPQSVSTDRYCRTMQAAFMEEDIQPIKSGC